MIRTASPEVVALDASAMVDLLTGRSVASPIRLRLRDTAIHVPAAFRRGPDRDGHQFARPTSTAMAGTVMVRTKKVSNSSPPAMMNRACTMVAMLPRPPRALTGVRPEGLSSYHRSDIGMGERE